ncbi:hypothetical protein NBRC110019_21680 [Neptunitalea chrysea]|uniref:Uncharacterized protein n=1 Tax=Neptunitalea chrysea TaxID=1647581 RepID=A0A9W6B8U4_9FLAO|nr:hypothetical protein NBRC110019_21680 [Neptunitalea chrysea]
MCINRASGFIKGNVFICLYNKYERWRFWILSASIKTINGMLIENNYTDKCKKFIKIIL